MQILLYTTHVVNFLKFLNDLYVYLHEYYIHKEFFLKKSLFH